MYKILICEMNIQGVYIFIKKFNMFCMIEYNSTQRKKNLF